jgi:hypothetical protein
MAVLDSGEIELVGQFAQTVTPVVPEYVATAQFLHIPGVPNVHVPLNPETAESPATNIICIYPLLATYAAD